jgi:hypothetical protein
VANGGVEALAKTSAANLGEIAIDGVPGWDRKLRKRIGYLIQLERAALSKLHGAADHFRRVGEKPFHLSSALDVELIAIELEALGIVDGVRRLHAQQHFMRMMIVFAEIVAVVGGDQRNIQFLFQPEEIGVDFLFQLESLILDFQEEVAAAENVLILAGGGLGILVFSGHEVAAELAGQTARETNQTLCMFSQKVLADARLAVETMK